MSTIHALSTADSHGIEDGAGRLNEGDGRTDISFDVVAIVRPVAIAVDVAIVPGHIHPAGLGMSYDSALSVTVLLVPTPVGASDYLCSTDIGSLVAETVPGKGKDIQ